MTTKSAKKISLCPQCGVPKTLRKVIYGLLDQEPDPNKYIAGGCCLSGSDPEVVCINCGWSIVAPNAGPENSNIENLS